MTSPYRDDSEASAKLARVTSPGQQDVKMRLSSATRDSEKAAETGISRTFYANHEFPGPPGHWPRAVKALDRDCRRRQRRADSDS